jgi:hypothetical protein
MRNPASASQVGPFQRQGKQTYNPEPQYLRASKKNFGPSISRPVKYVYGKEKKF